MYDLAKVTRRSFCLMRFQNIMRQIESQMLSVLSDMPSRQMIFRFAPELVDNLNCFDFSDDFLIRSAHLACVNQFDIQKLRVRHLARSEQLLYSFMHL
jgi:phosphoenolpyruvate carboxylase